MASLIDLNELEKDRFMHIMQESLEIKRHFQLFLWLQGDLQQFLPHEILISAVGKVDKRQMRLDLVSALPGVRTEQLAHCEIHGLVESFFQRWLENDRQAFALDSDGGLMLDSRCMCQLHATLRCMQSVLVHGIRDERGDEYAMYILLNSKSQPDTRYRRLFQLLVPQIDIASRRVASFEGTQQSVVIEPISQGTELQTILSARELEILDWVRCGKTNYEIGMILNISVFTVKNHLQRVFRKMNVTNRAQAVSMIAYKTSVAPN